MDGNGGGIVDLTTTLQCVQGNNPRSISFMIQTTSTGCIGILSTGGSETFTISYASCFGSTDGVLGVDIKTMAYYPNFGKVINDGLWHTVLVAYDGTLVSIYVDGRLDGSATNWNAGSSFSSIASTLNTIGNSNNYLGQAYNSNVHRWSGKLKNVIFYDYVITNSYALANSYQSAGTVLYTSGNLNFARVVMIR